jgi:LysM repeat protein
MLGQKYKVQKGDTLWDIAGKHLGNPTAWPRIYEHNNQPPVVAATKTKIANPDLIFIGQTIYIPQQIPSAQPKPVPQPIPKATGKKPAVRLKGVPFKYNLKNLPSSKVASPAFIAEIKLSGSITIQLANATDVLTMSQEDFVLAAKREADITLNKLVSYNQVGWNSETKQLHSKTA